MNEASAPDPLSSRLGRCNIDESRGNAPRSPDSRAARLRCLARGRCYIDFQEMIAKLPDGYHPGRERILEVGMLDAFIIERIRQQQRVREDAGVPLRIETPPPPPEPRAREEDNDDPGRGIVIIDFTI